MTTGRPPKGLHLHFDPLSGIAGDMTVAALVDVGVPRAVIVDAIAAMKVAGLEVSFDRRQRGAYVGTGFNVHVPGAGSPAARKSGGRSRTRVESHDHAGHDHDHDHDHAGHDHDHDHDHGPDDHVLAPPRLPRKAAAGTRRAVAAATHGHRDYATIRKLLDRAALDPDVKALAAEIFARIAQAESRLHGVPIDRIGFHEVGAYDSIADIVGASAAIVWLAPVAITSSPPVVGSGQVRTAHGLVPIPAPATAELLEGIPISSEGQGELTTPTGAGILATVVDHFGAAPPMRLHAQGFGAGTRELPDRANVLRVMIGEPIGEAMGESHLDLLLIETNVDDMNPQLVAPLIDALLAAGAVDAWATPILMKKGRPALTLSALCPPAAEAAVTLAFFEHSSTIGVRMTPVARTVLERARASVRVAEGNVAVKLSSWQGRILSATPEFEDCRRLATAAGVPVRRVLAAASAAAQALLPASATKSGPRVSKTAAVKPAARKAPPSRRKRG
jgi:uncharacterized protein (TIGR00299 family) protein